MKNKVHQVPALATIAMLSGCFHAALQPPSADASANERIEAYERLRPQADHQVVDRDGAVIDGTAVTDSNDLLPVLDPKTPAARAARRSAEAHHSASMWGIGGIIVAGAGITLTTVDLVSTSNVDGHHQWGPLGEDRGRVGEMVGLTAFAVGILAGAIGHGYYGVIEQREQHDAFVTYDASLRKSLRVCANGLEVIDCDSKVASTTR